jgi:hypothetical protein
MYPISKNIIINFLKINQRILKADFKIIKQRKIQLKQQQKSKSTIEIDLTLYLESLKRSMKKECSERISNYYLIKMFYIFIFCLYLSSSCAYFSFFSEN